MCIYFYSQDISNYTGFTLSFIPGLLCPLGLLNVQSSRIQTRIKTFNYYFNVRNLQARLIKYQLYTVEVFCYCCFLSFFGLLFIVLLGDLIYLNNVYVYIAYRSTFM